MGLDPTCRLCDPYNDAENGGCGGIGPNYVEKWTVNGTLSMKAAGFDAVLIGLSSSDISMANMAGVLGAIIIRLIIGPISDQIGLRLSYSSLLLVAALPGFGLCGPSTVDGRDPFLFIRDECESDPALPQSRRQGRCCSANAPPKLVP